MKKFKNKHRETIEKILLLFFLGSLVYTGWTLGRFHERGNQEKICIIQWDKILRKIKCDGSKCEYRY